MLRASSFSSNQKSRKMVKVNYSHGNHESWQNQGENKQKRGVNVSTQYSETPRNGTSLFILKQIGLSRSHLLDEMGKCVLVTCSRQEDNQPLCAHPFSEVTLLASTLLPRLSVNWTMFWGKITCPQDIVGLLGYLVLALDRRYVWAGDG